MAAAVPDEHGRFGRFGGKYVPETLMNALIELEEAYRKYSQDPEFIKEVETLLHDYSGRPTRLYHAQRLTEKLGGAKIYLKREDLNHTGAHKINNTIGQALLAKRMGRKKSSPKPARDSMASLRLPLRHCLAWNARYSWAKKI